MWPHNQKSTAFVNNENSFSKVFLFVFVEISCVSESRDCLGQRCDLEGLQYDKDVKQTSEITGVALKGSAHLNMLKEHYHFIIIQRCNP